MHSLVIICAAVMETAFFVFVIVGKDGKALIVPKELAQPTMLGTTKLVPSTLLIVK
jgi:hypothetical protein